LCRSKLQFSCERLLNGVNKLTETEALVTSMKADLARLQPVLEAKAAATADLLVKVCWQPLQLPAQLVVSDLQRPPVLHRDIKQPTDSRGSCLRNGAIPH
jgi:hypothetical protein